MTASEIQSFAASVADECRRGLVTVYWRPKQACVCKTRDTAIEDRFAKHIIGVYKDGVCASWVADDVAYWLTMRALDRAMAV